MRDTFHRRCLVKLLYSVQFLIDQSNKRTEIVANII